MIRPRLSLLTPAAVALLMLPSVAEAQVLSPGKLIRAHGALEARCTACHDLGQGVVAAAKCLACHDALRRRIAARRGYHGRRDTKRCVACHPDHKGRATAPTKWPGGRPAAFPHQATGYTLQGKHRTLPCRKCHLPKLQRDPSVLRLSAGARRQTYLGLGTACTACHADVHKGAAGKVCLDCHDQTRFKPVTEFRRHATARFPLLGKHRTVPCAKCHKPRDRFRGVPFARCDDCHRTPHRETMAHKAGKPRTGCKACHTADSWKQIVFVATSHPATSPLRGKHRRAGCKKCHGAKGNSRPKGSKCVQCHPTPHKKVDFGLDCKRCHNLSSWRVAKGAVRVGQVSAVQKVSAEVLRIAGKRAQAVAFHNKTRFPLAGKHIVVDCEKCHRLGRKRGQRLKRRFTKSFERCDDCHKDEHGGQFAKHGTPNVALASRCDSCHQTTGLFVASFSLAQHDQSRFPLKEMHRGVACNRCHGKRRAKALRFTYPDRDCRACHKDYHRGKYKLAAGDTQPLRCGPCHTARTFRAVAFDHRKTKLPLQGRHATSACLSCHRPGAQGETIFRGLDARCAACHVDPHQGQFAGIAGGCARCHGDAKTFKLARFDHDQLTRFPLRGEHRKAKCAACHHPVRLADGRKVTLYRSVDRHCRGCHRSRHEAAMQRWRARQKDRGAARDAALSDAEASPFGHCDDCHTERNWRELKRPTRPFEHGATGYVLRGRHRSAACADCHRAKQGIDRRCSSCHESRHRQQVGDCAECHEPHSWRTSSVLARHRRTRLPLTGQHARADCSACHADTRSGVFRSVPAACYSCHGELYRDPNLHPSHHGFDTRCERCHRPTGWVPASFGTTEAAVQHRSFPLSGKHGQQPCVACHTSYRPPTTCVSCHRADRARARTPDHRAPELAQRCQRCHGDRSWRGARYADHDRGFPLLGKHRTLACTDCHDDDTSFGRYNCTGCHRGDRMIRAHSRTVGFVANSRACKRCHPLGRR